MVRHATACLTETLTGDLAARPVSLQILAAAHPDTLRPAEGFGICGSQCNRVPGNATRSHSLYHMCITACAAYASMGLTEMRCHCWRCAYKLSISACMAKCFSPAAMSWMTDAGGIAPGLRRRRPCGETEMTGSWESDLQSPRQAP